MVAKKRVLTRRSVHSYGTKFSALSVEEKEKMMHKIVEEHDDAIEKLAAKVRSDVKKIAFNIEKKYPGYSDWCSNEGLTAELMETFHYYFCHKKGK